MDIKKEYSQEINDIEYILKNLENGRYYEKSGARMDGYLATNISQLRDKIEDLFDKIDSTTERAIKEFSKLENK